MQRECYSESLVTLFVLNIAKNNAYGIEISRSISFLKITVMAISSIM